MRKSRVIALAGVSSALALICVSASMFVQPMTLTFATLSAVFVLLPLTKKSWASSVLGYIVVSISAFLIGGIILSAPFIIFFGFYAILQRFIEDIIMPAVKKFATIKFKNGKNNNVLGVTLKYVVGYTIKLAYLQIALAILWFATSAIIPNINFFGMDITLTYLIFALGSIPLFLLYDLMMKLVFMNMKIIIDKKIPDSSTTTTGDRMFDSSDEESNKLPKEMTEEEREHDIFFNHDDESSLK